jgi:hypothetical protein
MHARRKELIRELKVESQLHRVAMGFDRIYQSRGSFLTPTTIHRMAVAFVERVKSLPAALVMVGYALGEELKFAGQALECSEATVRRTVKGRLAELRQAGRGLPTFLLKNDLLEVLSGASCRDPEQCSDLELEERQESACEEQTSYRTLTDFV